MTLENIFDQYAVWTETVAQYPVTQEAPYLVLGIADEWGELNQAVGDNYLAEAGDVCWYIARYCTKVLRVSFQKAFEDSKAEVPSQWSIISFTGTLAGIEKKRIRDGAGWSEELLYRKNQIAYGAIKKLLCTLSWLLVSRGYTIEEALIYNMKKLNKRLEVGTIKGDGDNR